MNLDAPKDFGISEEHSLLREQAKKLLDDRAGVEVLRKLADDDLGYDRELYAQLAELGWLGLTLPEDVGGAELGALHMALLFEQMGDHILAGPVLASTLAATAIQAAGDAAQRKALLPGIASGERIATLALLDGNCSWLPDAVTDEARPHGDGFVLNGLKPHVDWGGLADVIVAPFRVDGEITLFAVPTDAPGLERAAEKCIDISRRTSRVRFTDVRVPASAKLEGDGAAALQLAHERGWLYLSAEMLGGTERTLHITRDYAADRVQFNKKIGAFQAVKHPLVDIMVACENTRSLVYAAAAAADSGSDGAGTLARMAKASAGDAFTYATDRGVQLHGGFGFTWDCDIHFLFKRAMWSRATLGDARHHRKALAKILADA